MLGLEKREAEKVQSVFERLVDEVIDVYRSSSSSSSSNGEVERV